MKESYIVDSRYMTSTTADLIKPLASYEGELALKQVSPEVVRGVQALLIHFGLLSQGEVDGVVGEKTLKAFAEFKEKEYLAKPEVLGTTTVQALLQGYEEHPTPLDEDGIPVGEKTIVLPTGLEVYSAMPVYPDSNFTWGEMTKNLTRKPQDKTITNNIIKLARHLDKARDYLGGRSITVNSAYRPPAVNRAVGGVSNSRHILGDAIDIVVAGLTPFEVYYKLDGWHSSTGGLGKSSVFTHLDMRGYKARFKYGR